MKIKKFLAILIGIIFFNGCANVSKNFIDESLPPAYKVENKWYQPMPPSGAYGFKQNGIASWYGEDFHGKTASNGEIYNMHEMTAAHKTLPFETLVEVHNLLNDKKVVVRITDRGPFVSNRIIDLSYMGAKKLDMLTSGIAPVEIRVLSLNKNRVIESGKAEFKEEKGFAVQIGAFQNLENARAQKSFLSEKYNQKIVIAENKENSLIYYKVRAIEFKSLYDAKKFALELIEAGLKGVFIIKK